MSIKTEAKINQAKAEMKSWEEIQTIHDQLFDCVQAEDFHCDECRLIQKAYLTTLCWVLGHAQGDAFDFDMEKLGVSLLPQAKQNGRKP